MELFHCRVSLGSQIALTLQVCPPHQLPPSRCHPDVHLQAALSCVSWWTRFSPPGLTSRGFKILLPRHRWLQIWLLKFCYKEGIPSIDLVACAMRMYSIKSILWIPLYNKTSRSTRKCNFTAWVWTSFSPFSSQYWHDPLNLTNYVHGSHYLAIVNNEVEEKEVLYK